MEGRTCVATNDMDWRKKGKWVFRGINSREMHVLRWDDHSIS